jgi:transposase
MDDLLKKLQGIDNFHHINFEIKDEEFYWEIERQAETFSCSNCNSKNVTATFIKTRNIRCLSMGKLKSNLKVRHHRVQCHDCQKFLMEKLEFLPNQNCHYTKSIVSLIILLRNEMTISATARYLGLGWETVKEIEKEYLKEKYKTIDLNGVETIGIDEVFIGRSLGFITIVRELPTGKVLFIGKGKSGETLNPFADQLKKAGAHIKNVAVDLANSFSSWITEKLPYATIIYDKFHVIKLMNDKLNSVRRKTMNELCEEDKKSLKGKRFFLLRNIESLSDEKKRRLK